MRLRTRYFWNLNRRSVWMIPFSRMPHSLHAPCKLEISTLAVTGDVVLGLGHRCDSSLFRLPLISSVPLQFIYLFYLSSPSSRIKSWYLPNIIHYKYRNNDQSFNKTKQKNKKELCCFFPFDSFYNLVHNEDPSSLLRFLLGKPFYALVLVLL